VQVGIDQPGHDQHPTRIDRPLGLPVEPVADVQNLAVVVEEDASVPQQLMRAAVEADDPAAPDQRPCQITSR